MSEAIGEALKQALCHEFLFSSPPEKLGVAVSGGGDSLALLDLLHRLGQSEIYAVTVNHGLRAEAAQEAEFVGKFCVLRGIPHEVLDWSDWDGQGNLMAAARQARYRLIADWALERGVDHVALGHTKDDVAETFLMRLGRKSGLDGLSAMSSQFEKLDVIWHRPLLNVTRGSLRKHLTENDISWIEDPTNENMDFERTKVRKVLGQLATLEISVEEIASSAQNLARARNTLNSVARSVAAERIQVDRGDVLINFSGDEQVDREIVRRILIASLYFVSGRDYAPRSDALEQAINSLNSGKSHTISGCYLSAGARDCWRVTREFAAVRESKTVLGDAWDSRWTITGPSDRTLEIRALGEAVSQCPDWRETGMPRQSLLASPAVWKGAELIAAPIAGLKNGYEAVSPGKKALIATFDRH